MAGKKEPVIESPATEPQEISPEEESSGETHGGIGLIRAIYNFIVPRDLLAYTLAKKYKDTLDLSKRFNQVIFSLLLVSCMLIDFLFTTLIEVVILVLFLAIAISFIRGLGIVDWILSLISP